MENEHIQEMLTLIKFLASELDSNDYEEALNTISHIRWSAEKLEQQLSKMVEGA